MEVCFRGGLAPAVQRLLRVREHNEYYRVVDGLAVPIQFQEGIRKPVDRSFG